jgi:hypothetical protein
MQIVAFNLWETNNAQSWFSPFNGPRCSLCPCEYFTDGLQQPVIANHHDAGFGSGTGSDAGPDQLQEVIQAGQ